MNTITCYARNIHKPMVKAKTADIEKITSRSDFSSTLTMQMLTPIELEKMRQNIAVEMAGLKSHSYTGLQTLIEYNVDLIQEFQTKLVEK